MLVRVLISIGYPAALIAVWGVTSLVTDTDVISEPDASILLGPSIAVAAGLVTAAWVFSVRRAVTGPALGAVASVYLTMIVVGSLGYRLDGRENIELILFAARHATSPFFIGAALLSGAAVVLAFATSRPRSFDRPPPRG